ncbi:hypothetical protein [Mesobacillus subterraneus]|uniref:t-SNARE coiled-coil homology domain-containing protein n=1 Tax=Mesobacillus subterraneus TaxID=285983 RepID=A0A3R9FIP4_9BACI|nr:hypothetical protein [Mesobacillus subterraneus]RSD28954.1 hypothetical protein EJA10_02250 [Mesobacillus subterraneus]
MEKQILEILMGMQKDLLEVKTNVQRVETDIHEVKANVQRVETDVHEVKANVQRVETDVHEVKVNLERVETEVLEVKSNVQEIQKTVKRIEISQNDDVIAILKVNKKKTDLEVDYFNNRLIEMDKRLFVLEKAIQS